MGADTLRAHDQERLPAQYQALGKDGPHATADSANHVSVKLLFRV